MRCLVLVIFSCGCGALAPYTVSTMALRDLADVSQLDMTRDGPELVITAKNNTGTRAKLYIRCPGAPAPWIVDVAPFSEVHAIGQVMNKDVHVGCDVEGEPDIFGEVVIGSRAASPSIPVVAAAEDHSPPRATANTRPR